MTSRCLGSFLVGAAILIAAGPAAAQQGLGNKVMGTLGLDAGSQLDVGVSVAGRFLWYAANTLIDRRGDRLPLPLDLDVYAGQLGAAVTLPVAPLGAHLTGSFGWPIARVTAATDRAEASLDNFGLGDLYVQPLRLSWRLSHIDLTGAYGFYAPTGRSAPGGKDGVGRGHWTQEFSTGGTIFFDRERRWQLSALASCELNHAKRDVDVTRGATVQVQGGAGRRWNLLALGVVGYALWQISDDSGADLPAPLRGGRDRDVGLGAQLDINLRSLRSHVTVRYVHDLVVRSRPLSQLAFVGWTVALWRPRTRP